MAGGGAAGPRVLRRGLVIRASGGTDWTPGGISVPHPSQEGDTEFWPPWTAMEPVKTKAGGLGQDQMTFLTRWQGDGRGPCVSILPPNTG